jgi:topoisomerase-4 subunit B
MSKKIVYENEEFNLLQAALFEDDMENLRYNIVIATMPMLMECIRLLLITFPSVFQN